MAMRQAIDLVKSLRYKLRMFGVPIEGPSDVFCDNESVFKNVSRPESTLSKKQHSISYHSCREAVASKIVRVAKEDTLTNLADIFTKHSLTKLALYIRVLVMQSNIVHHVLHKELIQPHSRQQ